MLSGPGLWSHFLDTTLLIYSLLLCKSVLSFLVIPWLWILRYLFTSESVSQVRGNAIANPTSVKFNIREWDWPASRILTNWFCIGCFNISSFSPYQVFCKFELWPFVGINTSVLQDLGGSTDDTSNRPDYQVVNFWFEVLSPSDLSKNCSNGYRLSCDGNRPVLFRYSFTKMAKQVLLYLLWKAGYAQSGHDLVLVHFQRIICRTFSCSF